MLSRLGLSFVSGWLLAADVEDDEHNSYVILTSSEQHLENVLDAQALMCCVSHALSCGPRYALRARNWSSY